MRRALIVTAAALCGAALVGTGLCSGTALAAKGGNKGNGGGGGGGGDGTPVSPEIAYTRYEGRKWNVKVMDADGGNAATIVQDIKSSLSAPTWSPDGSELLFAAGTGFAQGRGIYRVAVDGSTGPSLVVSAGTTVTAPVWSPTTAPDGAEWIAFADYRSSSGSGMDIYVVDPDGGTAVNLTSGLGGSFQFPCWSPDASQLAVAWRHTVNAGTASEQVRNDLVLLHLGTGATGNLVVDPDDIVNLTDVSGSPLRDLADDAVIADQDYMASWGRTGDTLVVSVLHTVSGKDNNDLYEIPIAAPASAVRRTNTTASVDGAHTVGERHPSYSPDDSLAVFWLRGKGKGGSGIYTISLDGNGSLTALVGGDSVRSPSWFRGN